MPSLITGRPVQRMTKVRATEVNFSVPSMRLLSLARAKGTLNINLTLTTDELHSWDSSQALWTWDPIMS